MNTDQNNDRFRDRSPGTGKLFVVGIGPGGPLDRTRRAEEAIAASSTIVGYRSYLASIGDLSEGKELFATGMTKEVERCRIALRHACQGKTVSLVSSGDPGVYGMAGLAIELAQAENLDVSIEIIPGVTSANAAASRVGAPLMCDYAVISMSDLLVPRETIMKRVEAIASADFVTAIYNPRSRKRTHQLAEAASIFRKYRSGQTPVAIATAVGTEEEQIIMSDLDHFLDENIDMRSIVLIGNRSSRCRDGWFVTPRGYPI